MREVSTLFNTHLATLAKHLSTKEAGTLDYNGYSFRKNSVTGPWPEINKRRSGLPSLTVYGYDNDKQELHRFESVSQASKFTKLHYRQILRFCKRNIFINGRWKFHCE